MKFLVELVQVVLEVYAALPDQGGQRVVGRLARRVLNGKVEALPVLAAIASRVSLLDFADESLALQIEKAARMDPPLAFRVVRLAGSHGATSITGALDKLGAKQLSEAVSEAINFESFDPTAPAQRNLWLHALQVAGLASATAALDPDAQVDPAETYLIGPSTRHRTFRSLSRMSVRTRPSCRTRMDKRTRVAGV